MNSVTAILNGYRRPNNLPVQVQALRNQTHSPEQVWLWINHHEDFVNEKQYTLKELPIDRICYNDYNWKFYARFALGLLAETEYVAIFDDDTIPGTKWFENCLETMETHEGLLGAAGYIQEGPLATQYYREGWPSNNDEVKRVDYVGHAWFFRRNWLQYLWREKPPMLDNGEDIHFSYIAQKYGNLQTYCPPHPKADREMHGSIYGYELGVDVKATSTNQSISHQEFFSQRNMCIGYSIDNGWNTVKGIKK